VSSFAERDFKEVVEQAFETKRSKLDCALTIK
jgi:hypothetical protein